MKEYLAKKVTGKMTVTDERWKNATATELDYVWADVFPSPYTTTARLLHSTEGIFVKLSTNEWPLRITAMEHNASICVDSCMEFFVTPNTLDKDYINFEMNPVGATLTCIGEGRGKRERLNIKGEGVIVETLIRPECGWDVMLFVPYSFFNKYFSGCGSVLRANFFKCGDMTVRQHYSTWNPVLTERPDYHQPSYFGKIVLTDELV